MKKFHVKFVREFEVDIEAVDDKLAAALARQIMAQFPQGTCKLLSVIAEDYVPPPDQLKTDILSVAQTRNEDFAKKIDSLLPKDPA